MRTSLAFMFFSLAATVWGNGSGLAATFEHNCAGRAADAGAADAPARFVARETPRNRAGGWRI